MEERFAKYVEVGGPDDCWPWTGKKQRGGYGQFKLAGKAQLAHRVAATMAGILPPDGNDLVVRHTCDNPWCVNPAHLCVGTHADNVADRVARGRCAKGERNGRHVLTADAVREIRRRHAEGRLTPLEGAAEYGVTRRAIQYVLDWQTWKHVL